MHMRISLFTALAGLGLSVAAGPISVWLSPGDSSGRGGRFISRAQAPRSLAVEFLGLQDKPVPRLVIYPRDVKAEVEKYFRCGRECICADVSPEDFAGLVATLEPRSVRNLKDDPDAGQTGGFRFSLTELAGVTRTRSLNRQQSAALLNRAMAILPSGEARSELGRRFAIMFL
jgi:hypothetical protein